MRISTQPGGKSAERVSPANARRACGICCQAPAIAAPASPQAPETPSSPAAQQQRPLLPAPPLGGWAETHRPASTPSPQHPLPSLGGATPQAPPTTAPPPAAAPTNHDGAGEGGVEALLVVHGVHKAVGDAKLDVEVGEVGGDGAAQALLGRGRRSMGRQVGRSAGQAGRLGAELQGQVGADDRFNTAGGASSPRLQLGERSAMHACPACDTQGPLPCSAP
jgi:hypothetical protein